MVPPGDGRVTGWPGRGDRGDGLPRRHPAPLRKQRLVLQDLEDVGGAQPELHGGSGQGRRQHQQEGQEGLRTRKKQTQRSIKEPLAKVIICQTVVMAMTSRRPNNIFVLSGNGKRGELTVCMVGCV